MKEALVTLRVPLRDDYPWKPNQRPANELILNGAVDGIRWLDCVSGMIEAQIMADHDRDGPRAPTG